MKIKIIELLNMIAEGKELPEKFMYKGHSYYRQKMNGICYRCDELNEIFEECLVLEDLNDTIEIIEEPKKIEYPILHKTAPSETTGDQMPNWRNLIDCNFEYLNKTICQLIDEINNLKEND